MKKVFQVLCITVFMLTIVNVIYAQQVIKIEGTVVDDQNHTMPYVSLRIGRQVGTMTNNEGGFSLQFPDRLLQDSVVVSFIGYKTRRMSLSAFRNGIKIQLSPDPLRLKEVVISGFDAAAVIRKAMNNVILNYPLKPFEMIGFYREVGKIDSSYLSFAEASLNVLNQGYQKGAKKDLILINKERNLNKVGKKEVENPFNSTVTGVPYTVLENDILKNPGSIFGKDYIAKYNYVLSGSTRVNGEEAYIIDFDQKDELEEALYKGTVVLIKSSFAIVSLDFSLSPKGRQYAKSDLHLMGRTLLGLLGYHFQKLNEELSLRYMEIDHKWYPYFYKIAVTHHVKARKQKIDGKLNIAAELFISQINEIPKHQFKGKLVMRDNYSFKNVVNDYTEDYWSGYDVVKPEHTRKDFVAKFNRD